MLEWSEFMQNTKSYIGWGTAIIVLLSCFFEISKFKINPISFLVGRIFGAINTPILTKLDIQQKQLDTFSQRLDELLTKQLATDKKIDVNEVKRIRAEIMSFATSCKKREDHNEQQYQNIIKLHDEYNALIESTELINGVLDEDFNFIMMVYKNCRNAGKFYEGNCYVCSKDDKEEIK